MNVADFAITPENVDLARRIVEYLNEGAVQFKIQDPLAERLYHLSALIEQIESKTRDDPAWKRRYIARGGVECPFCGSKNLDGGNIDVDGILSTQDVTCTGCGRFWLDVRKLVDMWPDGEPIETSG